MALLLTTTTLQSRKFWWYLLLTYSTLLHNVIMTSYCCERCAHKQYAVSGNDFVFQQDTCNSWTAIRQEAPNFLTSKLWPPNSPDLSSVDYLIWAVMQHHVYRGQIHSVDELKRSLIDVWCGLEQSIFDETVRKTSNVCHVKGGHFEYNWQCWFCPTWLVSLLNL